METSWRTVVLVSEEPTPQEQLSIASAAMGQARRASVVPRWAPPIVGILGGIAISLVYMGLFPPQAIDVPLFAAGVALSCVLLGLHAWLTGVWRKSGVVPRLLVEQPTQRWKQVLLFVVPVAVVSVLGSYLGRQTGSQWMFIPFGVAFGGWLWFALAKQRAMSCRN